MNEWNMVDSRQYFYEVNDRFVGLNRCPRFRVEVNDPSFT